MFIFCAMLSHTVWSLAAIQRGMHVCVCVSSCEYGGYEACLISVSWYICVYMCLAYRKDWILNESLAIACPYQQYIYIYKLDGDTSMVRRKTSNNTSNNILKMTTIFSKPHIHTKPVVAILYSVTWILASSLLMQ